ncbi:hypothetical protein [Arthrobacter sp. Soil736]|uniref:hypothetical protein n=1 Tax=Arthrobacter sp. Soil736 TaxID=1736395 RepID=UPI001F11B555|nr:hypothetical protein [Arthrobacter sp. Soil736]
MSRSLRQIVPSLTLRGGGASPRAMFIEVFWFRADCTTFFSMAMGKQRCSDPDRNFYSEGVGKVMNPRTKIFFALIVLLLVVGGATLFVFDTTKRSRAAEYNPQIDPADFTTKITNKYFALPVGKKLTYETTQQGRVTERIEIEILQETMTIEGVETVVYLDKEYKNGHLVEETRDYLAQHRNGDVWYFGEDVNNYWNGMLLHHSGSFLHGKDGAKAGIWMKAEQRVGDSYRQEFYVGQAEDMRDIVATGETVSTKTGTYTDCVKVYDWTPLEKNSREHKYHCPQVGSLVLTEDLETGSRSELVNVVLP